MPYLCHHSYGATDPDPRLHLSDDCFDSYSPWFSVSLFHFLPQRERERQETMLYCVLKAALLERLLKASASVQSLFGDT